MSALHRSYDDWKTTNPEDNELGSASLVRCDRCEDGKELWFPDRPFFDDPYYYDFTGRPCECCRGSGYVPADDDGEDR